MSEDGGMTETVTVVPGAEPFSHDGSPVGVLLSHGFTGSPASMTPWAQYLADRGHTVRVPRLPGHGTTWQDMNRTRWDDWYATIDDALTELKGRCERVAVCGLSMGGSLGMRLAENRPDDVAALVLVNPVIGVKNWQLKLVPALKWVVPAMPGIGNDIKKPGGDEVGYDKTPLKALASQLQGWREIRADLGKITAPLLVFRVVTVESLHHLVERLAGPSGAASSGKGRSRSRRCTISSKSSGLSAIGHPHVLGDERGRTLEDERGVVVERRHVEAVLQCDVLRDGRRHAGLDEGEARGVDDVVVGGAEDEEGSSDLAEMGAHLAPASNLGRKCLERRPVVADLVTTGLLDVVADAGHGRDEPLEGRHQPQLPVLDADDGVDQHQRVDVIRADLGEAKREAATHRQPADGHSLALPPELGEGVVDRGVPVVPAGAVHVLPRGAVTRKPRHAHRVPAVGEVLPPGRHRRR